MNTGAPLLSVDNVSMHFGGLKAVDGVSLTVAAQQVVGLIGPNGSGKSTLINVISRIYDPTGGTVKLDDKEIAGVAVHEIAALGITRTFQNVRLFPTMTVRDNLRMGTTSATRAGFVTSGLALPAARREEKAVDQQVEDVAVLLGLEAQLDRVAGDLPYGLQKLTELGRALISNPKLILLDEPVAGMNSSEKQALVAALRRVRAARPVAFLLVEHDMAFVMSLTEYLYVLNFGKLIAQGSPEHVRADPGVIEAYLGVGHAES
ncbi:ABC transporter ATP-binding protein [Simplicispira suum]|uniref:ABC transporter ATP-binding protein n=1 Tax=Simplicispira suum TaxID=2109915 RepID=A0A2S0N6C9_9BURK|nr:ABC transporter ATP-binding protein [Simplicispira suum]AVO43513.1 ABC transporter ATP-binding protein [Simplicispira suum]